VLRVGCVDHPVKIVKDAAPEATLSFSGVCAPEPVTPTEPGLLTQVLLAADAVASPLSWYSRTLTTLPAPVAVVTMVLVSFVVLSVAPTIETVYLAIMASYAVTKPSLSASLTLVTPFMIAGTYFPNSPAFSKWSFARA
jgi:hypothetical protein